jgi:hypothetical protein
VTDPAFGLGHPGGLVVTGGLGHAEPAPAGVMAARITATTTITATLTAATARRGGGVVTSVPIAVGAWYADMAATVTGSARITATATADDDTAVMLMLLDLDLTTAEGVFL